MTIHVRSFIWFVPLLVASCAASVDGDSASSDDIVGGHADRGRTPAVVALFTDDGALCSGTLIAPDRVLTARHCVSETVEAVDCARPGRQVLANRDPSGIRVFVGDRVHSGGSVARGRSVVVPQGDRLCQRDVAVLLLDRRVEGVAPAHWARQSALRPGDEVDVVGFGLRGSSPHAFVGARYRRDDVAVLAVDTAEIMVGQAVCPGDSGGPIVDRRSGEVLGVLSRGTSPCTATRATNVFTRTDAFAALIDAALRSP